LSGSSRVGRIPLVIKTRLLGWLQGFLEYKTSGGKRGDSGGSACGLR
jgi:hypothetical protein